VTPRERELLTGMGNCFEACHADFDGTVGMVASSRGLTPEEVLSRLSVMRELYVGDAEYRRLRGRLPPDFPV
jgi:hypothetical protein